jgi:hypothetical protein
VTFHAHLDVGGDVAVGLLSVLSAKQMGPSGSSR